MMKKKNEIRAVPPILGCVLPYIYLILILGLPVVGSFWIFKVIQGEGWWLIAGLVIPWVYITLYLLTAGLLSRLHTKAIIPGRFKRTLCNPVYSHRRLYGLCWTSICYFTPLYWVVLSVPMLKTLCFRLFGYKGKMNFTLYPDTWIRDLPLLDFEDGVYISNRATLGTNMVLTNNVLMVDRISIGTQTIIGHLTLLAPGTNIGSKTQVGVAAAVGAKVSIGSNTNISPSSMINHGARIADNIKIQPGTYVGLQSAIESGITISPCSNIADGHVVTSQAIADLLDTSSRENTQELSKFGS